MLTLTLEPDIERRVAECAKRRGMSDADFVRALIEESLGDLDDVQMAAERLENPLPPLTSAETNRHGEPPRSFGELLAACPIHADDLPPRHSARVIRGKVFD